MLTSTISRKPAPIRSQKLARGYAKASAAAAGAAIGVGDVAPSSGVTIGELAEPGFPSVAIGAAAAATVIVPTEASGAGCAARRAALSRRTLANTAVTA